ncbi:MAG: hypothetical protein LUM44_11715 [Pyrinomonadaceae bacterium]|nr:hypothetical protein [Pyrinomonadaceae bacterium]
MSISTTETIGLCEQFVQFLQTAKTELKAKGLDVTGWDEETNADKTSIVVSENERDNLTAARKEKTKEVQTNKKRTYSKLSSRLDAVIGILGKDTPAAKEAARLRSNLIPQSKSKNSGNKSGNNNGG